MTAAAPHWDVFCRVVDNYGDAGFCWRLARLLVHAQRLDVTLWIDHVDALARIVDDVDPAVAGQRVDGVHVRRFDDAAVDARPGVAVIEAFGCGLPARFLDAMERERPVWVNLEYLSAEAWVDGVHGLPSPQPQRPLTRWFYFPGFTHATGGLLHERGLAALRDACVDEPGTGALDVSLFCYANRGLPALLETWAQGGETLRLQVAEGVATGDFAHWLGRPLPPAPSRVARGALQVSVLALVTQPAYDHRLWRCDLNIVRGEDSFVRAQWARTNESSPRTMLRSQRHKRWSYAGCVTNASTLTCNAPRATRDGAGGSGRPSQCAKSPVATPSATCRRSVSPPCAHVSSSAGSPRFA